MTDNNPTTQTDDAPDFREMSEPQLLAYCSDDAHKWAKVFCAINGGFDRDVMTGWFANAIEHSTDVRRKHAQAAPTPASLDAPTSGIPQDHEDFIRKVMSDNDWTRDRALTQAIRIYQLSVEGHLVNKLDLGPLKAPRNDGWMPSAEQCMAALWHEMEEPYTSPELGKNPPPINTVLWLFDGESYAIGQYKTDAHYPACFWSVKPDHGGDFVPKYWALPIAPAPDLSPVQDLLAEARFLLARLDDIEFTEDLPKEFIRDWMGHVEPSISRLRGILDAQPVSAKTDEPE